MATIAFYAFLQAYACVNEVYMILFEEDWVKYPTAIVHHNTKNESWIRLAALYKTMGVRNCYFHLSLLQPELADVDPHSKNLSKEMKMKILIEIQFNPWYFFREIMRLPAGNTPAPYRANRGGIALIWCFFAHIDTALIMPRQFGKSITADGIDLWLLAFGVRSTELFLFTKDADLRKRNVQRIKDIRNLLPPYLNPTVRKDLDNTEVVTCIARDNILRTSVGQPQKDRAINVGRGFTLPVIFVDEGPYIPNVHISLPALLAAGTTARDTAAANGEPYGNIFTTTAGKKDTKEGAFMYEMIHDGMYWTEKLLDAANQEDAWNIVSKNSKAAGRLVNITLSHRQLGKTDEWLRAAIATARSSKDDADRDFLNKWTSGTLSSPLSVQLNEAIAQSETDPVYVSMSNDKYQIRWYIPEDELESTLQNGQFIVGLDTSNAVGRDSNFMVIMDTVTMGVVGASTIAEANLHKYAIWLAKLLIRYPNFTLIPENKASGQAVIDTVSTVLTSVGICPFTRIYNRIVDNHLTMESEFKQLQVPLSKRSQDVYTTYKKYMGFQTTGQSRHFLYDTVFQEAANSCGHMVRDKVLSDEIKGLVIKNGRIDHGEGGHDDGVIAWLLAHWMIRYSKNLSFYGIDVNKALSMVSSDGAILTEEQMADKRKLIVINERIMEVKEKLQCAPTTIDRMRNEKILTDLVQAAQKLGETTYSTDAILEEVKTKRVSRQSLRESVRRFEARKHRARIA